MEPAFPALDLPAILPLLIVTGTAVVVLLIGVFLPAGHGHWLGYLGVLGTLGAIVAILDLRGASRLAYGGMVAVDDFFVLFGALALVVAALGLLLSIDYARRERFSPGEYYALILFNAAGMLVLIASADLIALLVGLELLSIALYVLTGFARGKIASEEGAIKYFLLGAFSFGFLVYGTAFVYGATGSTRFADIAAYLAGPGVSGNLLLLAGVGFLLVGFAFKLALVPFHMWTPDAYEGAPTPITGYMSVATKAAVFAALLRLLGTALPAIRSDWGTILWALAILTMVVGNIAAIAQGNIKRMLAYSSIAQAGYILVAVVAGGTLGTSSVAFYLLAYTFMNLGAFAVVIVLGSHGEDADNLATYRGLGRRQPLLAAAMAIFMLSLAGIPPTAGFMAKLLVFSAAAQANLLDLVGVGVVTSAIAAFYYLRVIVLMYMREPEGEQPAVRLSPTPLVIVVLAALVTIQLGIYPFVPVDLTPIALVR